MYLLFRKWPLLLLKLSKYKLTNRYSAPCRQDVASSVKFWFLFNRDITSLLSSTSSWLLVEALFVPPRTLGVSKQQEDSLSKWIRLIALVVALKVDTAATLMFPVCERCALCKHTHMTTGALAHHLLRRRPYFSRCPPPPASDHRVSNESGQHHQSQRKGQLFWRGRITHLTTMARTTTALLALAAFAGVAIAADDSNIGSRHAVDVKKVRISKKRRGTLQLANASALVHSDNKRHVFSV